MTFTSTVLPRINGVNSRYIPQMQMQIFFSISSEVTTCRKSISSITVKINEKHVKLIDKISNNLFVIRYLYVVV